MATNRANIIAYELQGEKRPYCTKQLQTMATMALVFRQPSHNVNVCGRRVNSRGVDDVNNIHLIPSNIFLSFIYIAKCSLN